MVIHTKGPKAERDRANLLALYRELCKGLHVKPLSIFQQVHLSNFELDRLCRDMYDHAPRKLIVKMNKRKQKRNQRAREEEARQMVKMRNLAQQRQRRVESQVEWRKFWSGVGEWFAGLFRKRVPKSKQIGIPFVEAGK